MSMSSLRPKEAEEAPPAKRVRSNVAELFSSGAVGGARVQELFQDLARMEVSGQMAGFQDLGKSTSAKNSKKDLGRKLKRDSAWPCMYTMQAPLWDPKSEQEVRHTRVCKSMRHVGLEMEVWESERSRAERTCELQKRKRERVGGGGLGQETERDWKWEN